jgi:hypothetical protein
MLVKYCGKTKGVGFLKKTNAPIAYNDIINKCKLNCGNMEHGVGIPEPESCRPRRKILKVMEITES